MTTNEAPKRATEILSDADTHHLLARTVLTRTATSTYSVTTRTGALLGFVSRTGRGWRYAYRVDGQTFTHDGFANRALAAAALDLARTA